MEFNVSEEVMIIGTSLFVLGFAIGPMIWGPLSELYGRKIPLFIGFFVFAVFQVPVAVATNLETIMLCRYFGGLFGSSALAIIAGALADFWNPVDRGVAICFFAGATFLGPVFGPIIGATRPVGGPSDRKEANAMAPTVRGLVRALPFVFAG